MCEDLFVVSVIQQEIEMGMKIFLVNDDGVRAKVARMVFEDSVDADRAWDLAQSYEFKRYVLLNSDNVQLRASDERDCSGAYLPY